MERIESISLTEARAKLGELVNQVRYRGGGIMLTKNGEDVAAIVPASLLEDMLQEREKAKASLRAIQETAVEIYGRMSEDEVQKFVAEEIAVYRAERGQQNLSSMSESVKA